jgi:hypothetical protein
MAHDNIAFQERFPLSILACISLPFSFFVVTVPVMGVDSKGHSIHFARHFPSTHLTKMEPSYNLYILEIFDGSFSCLLVVFIQGRK